MVDPSIEQECRTAGEHKSYKKHMSLWLNFSFVHPLIPHSNSKSKCLPTAVGLNMQRPVRRSVGVTFRNTGAFDFEKRGVEVHYTDTKTKNIPPHPT